MLESTLPVDLGDTFDYEVLSLKPVNRSMYTEVNGFFNAHPPVIISLTAIWIHSYGWKCMTDPFPAATGDGFAMPSSCRKIRGIVSFLGDFR